jgi:hypothetical protein
VCVCVCVCVCVYVCVCVCVGGGGGGVTQTVSTFLLRILLMIIFGFHWSSSHPKGHWSPRCLRDADQDYSFWTTAADTRSSSLHGFDQSHERSGRCQLPTGAKWCGVGDWQAASCGHVGKTRNGSASSLHCASFGQLSHSSHVAAASVDALYVVELRVAHIALTPQILPPIASRG